MNRPRLLCSLALLLTLSASAQDSGSWRAASNTAHSITGDIALSGDKLWINFSAFTVAQIRALTPLEIGAVFDADSSAPGVGNLYRLNIPATKKFLHKTALCGGEDTAWMLTYASGKTLNVAFFSGSRMPALTIEGVSNSTDLCGTFTYTR